MNSIDRHWERARRYLAQGQFEPAHATLESMQAIDPNGVRTQLLGAELAWQAGKVRKATEHARLAAQAPNEDETLACGVIDSLLQTGETVLARACLERPFLQKAGSVPLMLRLAGYWQRLGEHAKSLAWLERIRDAGGDTPDTHYYRGQQLVFNGRLREAEEDLEACLRLRPEHGRAAQILARLRRQTSGSNHLERMAEGLRRVVTGSSDHAALEFARYKELEDLAQWDEAWEALENGNRLMSRRNPTRDGRQEHALERLAASSTWPQSCNESWNASEPQAIFVVGLPRSGSTVLERMLGNHPDIHAAGELQDFGKQLCWVADTHEIFGDGFPDSLRELDADALGRRYLEQTQWRAAGKRRFVDKQLSNWMLVGLIRAALPGARILHTMRKPMDICFSNWRAYFGDTHAYSYQLDALLEHYVRYRDVMDTWHRLFPGAILDVPYSDLVGNPAGTIGRVLEFCGLRSAPECADIASNRLPVATLSSADIRHGLQTHAPSVWLPYARQLATLREVLDRAGSAEDAPAP